MSHSKDSHGLVLRKVSHLSYLSHLFIKYTNLNREINYFYSEKSIWKVERTRRILLEE